VVDIERDVPAVVSAPLAGVPVSEEDDPSPTVGERAAVSAAAHDVHSVCCGCELVDQGKESVDNRLGLRVERMRR
jgi:hypothetical protein